MKDVRISPLSLDRLRPVLPDDRADALEELARKAQQMFDGRVVWNVNSTASGGGVAEMLQTLVAYGRGAGVDTRWIVIEGDPEFFAVTKRLHNALHGVDSGDFTDDDRRHYEEVLDRNRDGLAERVREGDIVLVHDPQPAGLLQQVRDLGAHPVWRCHIGRDVNNDATDAAWSFLRPYLEPAQALVFSRKAYLQDWMPGERTVVIPPSIDPFATKNIDLDDEQVLGLLSCAGLVADGTHRQAVEFPRRDGPPGTMRAHDDVLQGGDPPPVDAPLVVQVSRWDRLKDMSGVMQGFVEHLDDMGDGHLMLAGPAVAGVSDDPEGQEVLSECQQAWEALDDDVRARVHLACVPMDDPDENAAVINALQRHARVVVQKSLVEGYGLTVTEAMWKGRPVVASAVGGIQDQIVDGESGTLLADPHDLDEFAAAVSSFLTDKERADRMGAAARERVREKFLGDRHLTDYMKLFATLLDSD